MKKVKKAIALVAVILGISTASFAQNGLSIRGGGNFPVGTFAKGDATNIALNSIKSELGGAATGFNVGVKYQLGLLGGISAFASADLFYNSLKSDIKEDLKNAASLLGDDNYTTPAYMNLPVMVGVNWSLLNIVGTKLWVEAGAGPNFRNITSPGNDDFSYEATTTLAWQIGVGASLGNRLSLGLHYYGFGASEIDLDSKTAFGDAIDELRDGELKPSMMVLRLGVHF